MASEDTEITLGVGRLLGLFFLLAAICGVFFAIGYSLGKSNAREQALNDQPTQVLAASPPAATADSSEEKSPAAVALKSDAGPSGQNQATTSNPQSNLTFYKAVQQTGDSAETVAKSNPPTVPQKAPAEAESLAANASPSAAQPTEAVGQSATPSIGHPAPVTGPGTIVVQIAALSREDDAVALTGALRQKHYNVFVVNNPTTNDRYYHVQVGPFATMQEAEAMKTKLIAEGYNPIVKR